jgi:hypothetical protein
MDPRVALVAEFYEGLPKDRAKVETYETGFEYLEGMMAGGVGLEYGEMVFPGNLHKYKLSNLPEGRMNELLLAHVRKEANVCLYFGDKMNSLFCFNLDNNHKTNNTEVIPEMGLGVELLRGILSGLGCEPLVIASGRGYHLWCRVAGAIENEQLYNLMLRAMAKTMLGLHRAGMDHNKIKANFYPDPRSRDIVSLRLFGSEHMKNRLFSRVLTGNGLLDEAGSWRAFEDYLRTRTISVEAVRRAYEELMRAF